MSNRKRIGLLAVGFFLCCFVAVSATAESYTLSGTVRDTAAHGVPSATVTARSIATGKTYSTKTNSDGAYAIGDLAGGDYEVSAVAGELQAPPIKVTLAAAQTTDLTVSPSPKQRSSSHFR